MRKAWLAVLVLMADGLVRAQTGVIPVYLCSLPGSQANVSGLKSINYQDGVIPSCTVTVYLTGTTSIATTTPQSPFTANTDGSIPPISAPLGIGYDVCMSGGIAPNTYPIGHPNCLVDLWPGGSSGGGGGGTVTSFTSGNLPPLFNTSVANPTTTPVQTFTAINQGAQTAFGNWSGATAPPFFATIVCAGVLSCGYNSGSNSFTLSASSYQTIIQVNGTPTTPVSPVNLNDTTPAATSGFINGNFQQDGSGNVSVEVPDAPSQFTMQTIPPTTGQYAIVDFTVVSSPGGGARCVRPGAEAAGSTTSGAAIACGDPFDPETAGLTWSVPVLPSYIIPANVTAIYVVAFAAGSTLGAGSYTMGCSMGVAINPVAGQQISKLVSGLGGWTGANIGSQTCNIQASDEQGFPAYGGIGVQLIELYVYYTGPAPPVPPSQVHVMPPLYWDPTAQILGINEPSNYGLDTGLSGSAYVVNILGFPGVVDGNYPGIPLAGNLPGVDIWFAPAHTIASTTPTLDFNGITGTITGPTGGALSTGGSGDINTGQLAHVVAQQDGTWALQNPQVSGGSLANALTGAASSGASPGSTYDGSAAVTFDYHTFGAAGLAASNTFSGATTNDYSGTSQFKLPVAAGYAAAAQGEVGYDSTDKNWNLWANGANNIAATFPAASPPSDTDCAQWSVSGGHYVLSFASGSCGTGSGGDTITSPNGTLAVGGTSTNTTLDVKPVSAVADTSTPVTVSTAFPAEFHFNENATPSTAITYDLPTAAAGKQFCFKNSNNGSAANTGTLKIQTSASGQYIIDATGTLSASDGYVISGGAASDGACVVGVDSTHWQLYVGVGTWTTH